MAGLDRRLNGVRPYTRIGSLPILVLSGQWGAFAAWSTYRLVLSPSPEYFDLGFIGFTCLLLTAFVMLGTSGEKAVRWYSDDRGFAQHGSSGVTQVAWQNVKSVRYDGLRPTVGIDFVRPPSPFSSVFRINPAIIDPALILPTLREFALRPRGSSVFPGYLVAVVMVEEAARRTRGQECPEPHWEAAARFQLRRAGRLVGRVGRTTPAEQLLHAQALLLRRRRRRALALVAELPDHRFEVALTRGAALWSLSRRAEALDELGKAARFEHEYAGRLGEWIEAQKTGRS